MSNNTETLEEAVFSEIETQHPFLKKFILSRINMSIFNCLLPFNQNRDFLTAALIQNPFGITDLKKIKSNFGSAVFSIISDLNYLHRSSVKNSKIFRNYASWKNIIVLYLVNYVVIFEKAKKNKKAAELMKEKKIRFAMKLLENLDISEIRSSLEDSFFSILEPGIYNNYKALLKFTKESFFIQQKKITREFQKLFKKARIKAEIQSRLKTIYSIHKKIVKKNILFSQVLDTVGLRILLRNEDDCYRAMVLILKKCPIMTSLVKDYIAIPKENGYQSIHLTIIYDDHPVEIQIRTFEMHRIAQYGSASHFEYKKADY